MTKVFIFGARAHQIFHVLIMLILTTIKENSRTWQNASFALLQREDTTFARFAHPALKRFRHPWGYQTSMTPVFYPSIHTNYLVNMFLCDLRKTILLSAIHRARSILFLVSGYMTFIHDHHTALTTSFCLYDVIWHCMLATWGMLSFSKTWGNVSQVNNELNIKNNEETILLKHFLENQACK